MPGAARRGSRRLTSEGELSGRLLHMVNGGEQWTRHHASTFLLTFFSFALIHAARKTLSVVKPSMIQVWIHNTSSTPALFPSEHAAQEFLGMLDSGFMVAYAIGLFGGGVLGDRFDPRSVLSIGMWLSALAVIGFGFVTELFRFHSKSVYLTLWIASGLFQSVAWPTEVAIMGNWFGHGSRGAVMGVWATCASAGNIIGTLVASRVVRLGYEYAFLVNGSLLFGFAVFVFTMLYSSPEEMGLPPPPEHPDEANRVIEEPSGERRPISFWKAWLLPGVIAYSLAYACLKLVNYGFFFWLPYYLNNNFGWSEQTAGDLSTWYDVGGIIASIVCGAITVSQLMSSGEPYFILQKSFAAGGLGGTDGLFVHSIVMRSLLVLTVLKGVTGDGHQHVLFGVDLHLMLMTEHLFQDHFTTRTPTIVIMLLCSTFALFGYAHSPASLLVNGVLLAVAGVFIGGPSNMISGAVSQDLGKARELRGNAAALSTVTGIVDGTGSAGAAIGQLLVPAIQSVFGWKAVFYAFILMMFATALILFPLMVRELKEARRGEYTNLSDDEAAGLMQSDREEEE